jgi:hypothetical protein
MPVLTINGPTGLAKIIWFERKVRISILNNLLKLNTTVKCFDKLPSSLAQIFHSNDVV